MGSHRVARWHIIKTKINLGKFWSDLHWKLLVYFMSIWSILRQFGMFCGHLVYFIVIWYVFPRFGMLYQEKCGNPGQPCHASRSPLATLLKKSSTV
jgi:hypothetical protein